MSKAISLLCMLIANLALGQEIIYDSEGKRINAESVKIVGDSISFTQIEENYRQQRVVSKKAVSAVYKDEELIFSNVILDEGVAANSWRYLKKNLLAIDLGGLISNGMLGLGYERKLRQSNSNISMYWYGNVLIDHFSTSGQQHSVFKTNFSYNYFLKTKERLTPFLSLGLESGITRTRHTTYEWIEGLSSFEKYEITPDKTRETGIFTKQIPYFGPFFGAGLEIYGEVLSLSVGYTGTYRNFALDCYQYSNGIYDQKVFTGNDYESSLILRIGFSF